MFDNGVDDKALLYHFSVYFFFLLVKHFCANIYSYSMQAYRTPCASSLLFRLDFIPSAWPLVEAVPPAGCLPRPRFFRPS